MIKDSQTKKVLYYLLFLFLMGWTMISLATEVRLIDTILMLFILVALVLALEKFYDYNLIRREYKNQKDVLNQIFIANDGKPEILCHKCAHLEDDDNQYELTRVLDSMICISYLKDFENSRTIGNKKFDELRCSHDAVCDLFYEDLFLLDDPFEFNEEDMEVISKRKLCKYTKEINLSDSKVWFEVNKAPVFDNNSKLKGVVVILKNVTPQVQIQLEKETFVETLKHDLKTPAYAQIQALNLLMKGDFGNLSKEQKIVLQDIQNSCRYMFDMISTIINTYKFEDGLLTLSPTDFNVIKLVKETYKEVSYLAKEKGQHFVLESRLVNETINGDFLAIRRVIMNLIYNAIHQSYSNADIKITITEEYENVVFKVKSKGFPIPDESLDEIYSKYFMTKNKFRLIGMGLGLYLSKEIIKMHNGEMIATSDENGNTFGFVMPRRYTDPKAKTSFLASALNIRSDAVESYAEY